MEQNLNTVLNRTFDNFVYTQNGDVAYKNLQNPLLDILFKSEYLRNHLDEVTPLGTTDKEKLFAQFMRDPRYGLGQRNLGRHLLKTTGASFAEIILSGRGDDLWKMYADDKEKFAEVCSYVYNAIKSQSFEAELLKKWCPRFPHHNYEWSVVDGKKIKGDKKPLNENQVQSAKLARRIADAWKMNKQKYTKFIKAVQTPEYKLSTHTESTIKFEQVPSLASIKYAHTFATKSTLAQRYAKYLEEARAGKAKLNVTTTTVYDIYKNRNKDGFDPDLFFSKIEKITGSFLCVVDMSSSMSWPENNDAQGKALAIGHYLAMCSTYCNRQFVTFSDQPSLVNITGDTYKEQIDSYYGARVGYNTDLGKVMDLLAQNPGNEMPEYVVVLSDMQFDEGSTEKMESLMRKWKQNGYTSKLIWWNLAAFTATCPQMDDSGNIFMSGYSPMLLGLLEAGFDGNQFLEKLLTTYAQRISEAAAAQQK